MAQIRHSKKHCDACLKLGLFRLIHRREAAAVHDLVSEVDGQKSLLGDLGGQVFFLGHMRAIDGAGNQVVAAAGITTGCFPAA